jgi:hypothetical protein
VKASRFSLVAVLAPLLLIGACNSEVPTQPSRSASSDASDPSAKLQPQSTNWVGRALPFVSNLRVHSIAATPTRVLATTLDSEDKLVTVDELGVVGTFSFEFTAAADAECSVAISPGYDPNLPADEIWVTRGNELLRLSPVGDQMASIATLPAGQGDVAGLCFDHVGSFGHALLLLSEAGNVYTLESDTMQLALLGSMAPGGRAPSVASHQFGTHAGNLLVSYPDEDVVRGMNPDGLVSYVIGWSGVTSAVTVPDIVREYGRSQGAFFVGLENGTVYRFAGEDIGSIEGQLLVTSRYRSGSGIVTPQGVGYSVRAFSRFWGPETVTAVVQRPAVTLIEVSPQSGAPNPSFVQGSQTLIHVTLLSSPWFWPNMVDTDTVTLAGAPPVPFGKNGVGSLSDLNGDGVDDLKLFFRPADMQAPLGNVQLPLVGQTMEMEAFEGRAHYTVLAP